MSGLPVPNLNGQGLLHVASLGQLLKEEKAQAELTQNQPLIQGLAAYVRKCFDHAQTAKRQTMDDRLQKCVRQRRGEYDPEVLADIRKSGGSEIYMMLSSNKCRAAGSWVKDVMFGTKDQAPWDITHTAEPDISPTDVQDIVQTATNEAMQFEMQMGMAITTEDQMRDLVQKVADRKVSDAKDKAERMMKRMRVKMEDQLQEGGFYKAVDAFIDDLTTFPYAVMKGPVPRKRKKVQWVQGQGGQYTPDIKDVIQLEWERVDPFQLYWAAHATDVDDGYLIERHQLTRGDLQALVGVEGYDEAAIKGALDTYGQGGLRDWLSTNNTEKLVAEGKSITAIYSDVDVTIDALQFWGNVQGKMLVDWGMDEAEVADPLAEYSCEIWVVGQWVIKAMLNPNPCGDKPYYKTSYETIPGAWAGNGVCDLVRDAQSMCNSAARALCNNMGIASGPQVWVNVDRLATGEDVTQIYPWRIWQTGTDPYGGSTPPVQFFQPNSNAQELMAIYKEFSVLADEYSGVPRYMTGDSPAGGAGRTASGMSMLMGNAGKSIKQVIGNIDSDVTQPLIERLYYYNMRYSDDPELKGDARVVARGVNVLVAKEQAQVRMNEILQIIANNPMFVQIVGEEAIADLLREVCKPLNMNIVPDKEVIRARVIQQQQIQMMMAMQAAGGNVIDGQAQRVPPKTMPGNRQQLQNGAPITDNFSPQRRAA